MANINKIFTGSNLVNEYGHAQVRSNREYLMNQDVATEMNVYDNFGVFRTYNDAYTPVYDAKGDFMKKGAFDVTGPGATGVRSLFNPGGAVLTGNGPNGYNISDNAGSIRIVNNVPLMDSPSNRNRIKAHSGCSIKELVQASQQGLMGRAVYSYADFMYCKYLGRLPNNYLITLRKFPAPIGDVIHNIGEGSDRNAKAGHANHAAGQMGCMVTWMGTPGNEMENILKYSYNMPFKEQDAQWQEPQSGGDQDSQKSTLGAITAAFDPEYRRQYQSGHGGAALEAFNNKFLPISLPQGPYDINQESRFKDENKVYGPIDRVKSTYMRDSGGLKFSQNITITFDYELRSYDGINTRQAMLDLLANILTTTYTTGGFWGGGYRGWGMHHSSMFDNLQIFKARGGFTNFVDAFTKDVNHGKEYVKEKYGARNFFDLAKEFLNNIGGMLMSGILNKLGRPMKTFANSLLSEEPVGLWHLTIGNPHHPILSLGNMIIKNTTIEHYGPLGLDDFPTGLKVTVELDRGKPRDAREIEKMYMGGNDRIYSPMGPKIMDMYTQAVQYKQTGRVIQTNPHEHATKDSETSTGKVIIQNREIIARDPNVKTKDDLAEQADIIMKHFGYSDMDGVLMSAMEQEYGSQKKPVESSDSAAKKTDGNSSVN